jgi:hypothetical protein
METCALTGDGEEAERIDEGREGEGCRVGDGEIEFDG